MAKFTLKEEKEKELKKYIGSEYVRRVTFSLTESAISVVFKNDKKVNLKFSKNYRFEKLFLTNSEIGKLSLNGVYLEDEDEVDKAMLSFIYNVINRTADSFIFYSEQLIKEFDKNQTDT